MYRAPTKPASSGSLADLVASDTSSHSHHHLPLDEDDDDDDDIDGAVPDMMLTAPGLGRSRRAQFFNVAVLALLGLATAADLTRRGVVTGSRVDWGADSSAQFYYDDLSTEGIVHPSRFGPPHSSGHNAEKGAAKSRLGLGSAMIGSVTTALSPILPFAGGVDLRRGEAWGLGDDQAGSTGWIRGALDAMWDYKDASSGGWGWTSASSPTSSVNTVAQMPRGGGAGGARSKAGRGRSQGAATMHREAALSASDPFLPKKDIARLSLGDMTTAFRYAVESGRDGFDRHEFIEKGGEQDDDEPLNDNVKKALDAIDSATAKSRGAGVEPARTSAISNNDDKAEGEPLSPDVGYGDVDALQFCAAMRLFAEWRVLRQVPEGYKGYAVGMGLGHKDVVQNVIKIESAVHDVLSVQDNEAMRDTTCADEPKEDGASPCPEVSQKRSPTLRDLLRYEVEHQVQSPGKLPRLKEKSAAMGLLWVRRQLHYQTVIFSNMLQVGSVFPSAIDAVKSAYSEVYDKFHGWAVQKIFNYSFQAAPDTSVIFRHMNPAKLMEVTAQAQSGDVDEHVGEIRFESTETTESETVSVVESSSSSSEERIVSEDTTVTKSTSMEESWDNQTASEETVHTLKGGSETRDTETCVLEEEAAERKKTTDVESSDETNPWVKFGVHVASEWDKLGRHIGGEWDKLAHHVVGECDKLGKHVGGEWDKLASNVARVFHKDSEDRSSSLGTDTDVRGGAQAAARSAGAGAVLTGEALEEYVSGQMARDAHAHIERYLGVVRPLLTDLAGLFDEMNMDDPTKV